MRGSLGKTTDKTASGVEAEVDFTREASASYLAEMGLDVDTVKKMLQPYKEKLPFYRKMIEIS